MTQGWVTTLGQVLISRMTESGTENHSLNLDRNSPGLQDIKSGEFRLVYQINSNKLVTRNICTDEYIHQHKKNRDSLLVNSKHYTRTHQRRQLYTSAQTTGTTS